MIHNCTQFNPKFHLFLKKKLTCFYFTMFEMFDWFFRSNWASESSKNSTVNMNSLFFSNRSIFCAIKSFSCYLFSLCCPLSSMYIKDCLRCVFFVSCYNIWRWHLLFFHTIVHALYSLLSWLSNVSIFFLSFPLLKCTMILTIFLFYDIIFIFSQFKLSLFLQKCNFLGLSLIFSCSFMEKIYLCFYLMHFHKITMFNRFFLLKRCGYYLFVGSRHIM